MGYRSYVGAAIGGAPTKMKEFLQAVKQANIPDEDELLDEFKLIDLESDFTIYVFYSECVKWYGDCEETWKELINLAQSFHLSLVFNRVGESYDDFDSFDNFNDVRETRMLDLFGIEHYLSVNHPKLVKHYLMGEGID